MEHFRSTIATASAAVLGLVAAAHILHPGNFEAQPRPARQPVAAASAPAWVDPPAQIRSAAAPRNPDLAAILAPRRMAALPPEFVMAPTLPSELTPQPPRARKAERAARRPSVQRAAHIRQAALQAAPDRKGSAASADAARPAAEPATTTDPIGALIRGLGLGRDS